MTLANEIVALLQANAANDGPAGAGYRKVWATLARKRGEAISKDAFDAAVTDLVKAKQLAPLAIGSERPLRLHSTQGGVETERELMPGVEEWLQDWLTRQVIEGVEITDRALTDTSKTGPASGAAAAIKPDFMAAFVCGSGAMISSHFLYLVSFELKRADAAVTNAINETIGQSAHVNQAYLIWHYDSTHISESKIQNLKEQCRSHELGFVTFEDSDDPSTFSVLAEPVRTDRDQVQLERFLKPRLPGRTFRRLVGSGGGG